MTFFHHIELDKIMISRTDIKFIKSLGQKKFRKEFGYFVAEGDKTVSELVKSQSPIEMIYGIPEYEAPGRYLKVYTEITKKEMQQISQLTSATDVLVLVKISENEVPDKTNHPINILLDH